MRFLIIFITLFSSLFSDPIDTLNKDISNYKILSQVSYKEDFEEFSRHFIDITLKTKDLGIIKFTVSLPSNKDPKNLRCLIVLNGLETGRNTLKLAPNPDDFAIIGYEYPKNLHRIRNKSIVLHIPSTRKAALDVPSQLLLIAKWAEKQEWMSTKPVNIMGLSFGAIFVPAAYHLAEIKKIELGPGILAFGGAGLYDIFYANIKKYKYIKAPTAYLGYLIFKPLDPIYHMPYIKNKFLIINGAQDKFIPKKSVEKLQRLANKNSTIINLNSIHIQPEKNALLDYVAKISEKWLREN